MIAFKKVELKNTFGEYLAANGKTQARIAYVLNEDELKLAGKCLAEGLRAYRKQVMGLR